MRFFDGIRLWIPMLLMALILFSLVSVEAKKLAQTETHKVIQTTSNNYINTDNIIEG